MTARAIKALVAKGTAAAAAAEMPFVRGYVPLKLHCKHLQLLPNVSNMKLLYFCDFLGSATRILLKHDHKRR